MFIFLSKILPLLVYPVGVTVFFLLILSLSKKITRTARILVILSIILLWGFGNTWISNLLAKSLEWQYLPNTSDLQGDVMVVLGGGTEAYEYPRMGSEINSAGDRILVAARLYNEGTAPKILLSGGTISFMGSQVSTPASQMSEVLSLMGIPDDALISQDQSQNTYEDALYSCQMIQDAGYKKIILVTSAMHMPRSVKLFAKQGCDVIPVAADFTITEASWERLIHPNLETLLINLIPTSSDLNLSTKALKEYLGMLIYTLQGWI
jgi:uncharacterized SAM-binding protein YcdF (DUF218 family)